MKASLLKISAIILISLVSCAFLACSTPEESEHTHAYVETVVNPTCTEQGYTLHKCSCEDSYKDTYVNKLDHSFTSYASNNDATCEKNGTETAKCDGCEATDTREVANSKLSHKFTNYVYNNDAKCEANGTESAYCDNGCTEVHKKTAEGTALSHRFTNYISNGNGTKTATCNNNCGKTHTIDEEHVHDYKETVINPTCTEQGYTLHKCSCEDSYKDTYVKKLDHSFTSYASNNDATCEKNGTETAKCDGCEATDTREVANSKLDHSFTSYASNNNATCEKNGTETAKCDGCEATDTREVANSKLSHSFTSYVSNGDGTKTAKCDGCDKTDTIDEYDFATIFTVNSTGETVTGLTALGKTLSSITIPAKINGISITAIDGLSFAYCENLEEILIGKNVTAIGTEAFYCCDNLRNIKVGDDNGNYKAIDGNLYTKDGKALIQYAIGKTDNAFTVPAGTERICEGAFYNCRNLKSVVISDSVIAIENDAFGVCENLESVKIGNGVAAIGDKAFSSCISLQKAVIGSGVVSIGNLAFSDCYRLVEVYNKSDLNIVAGANDFGLVAYYAQEVYTADVQSKVSTDESGYVIFTDGNERVLVNYVGEAKELIIPDGVTKITIGAFYGNRDITSAVIPDSVRAIGFKAFFYCNALEKIIIPSSVATIGANVFYRCDSLTIYCEAGKKPAGWENSWNPSNRPVKWGCAMLDGHILDGVDVIIPANCMNVGARYQTCIICQQQIKIENIPLSEHIFTSYTSNGDGTKTANCDMGCGNTSTLLENEDIDWSKIFVYYDSEIVGLTKLGETLSSITVPAEINGVTITTIGPSAFWYCENLERVVIGDNIVNIESYAFGESHNLKEIVIGKNVYNIGYLAFVGDYSLTNIEVAEDNEHYKSIDGNLYTKDGKTLIQYAIGKTDTAFTTPDSVTTIMYYSFNYSRYLEKIVIGDNVTVIENNAFQDSIALREVIIGDNVTAIGEQAFASCPNLTSVVIGDKVTKLESRAFYNCGSLTNVTMGNKITAIGDYAFSWCDGLKSLTFKGTQAEWAAVEKGYWWSDADNVVCIDGVVSI